MYFSIVFQVFCDKPIVMWQLKVTKSAFITNQNGAYLAEFPLGQGIEQTYAWYVAPHAGGIG